jgi:hypothetical protein
MAAQGAALADEPEPLRDSPASSVTAEPNADFEALCDGEPDVSDTVNHAAGGRPKGLTAEKARMRNLPEQPDPLFLASLTLLFDRWAAAADCPEIALTQQEAIDLALPWTQLAAYFGWADRIPPWAQLAIAAGWQTYATVKVKSNIARQAAAARTEASNVQVDSAATPSQN